MKIAAKESKLKRYKAKVKKVISGDLYALDIDLGLRNMWCLDQLARLYGVFCVPGHGKNKCQEGLKIKAYAMEMIHGQEVIIDLEKDEGGRIVVKMFAKDHVDPDGQDVYIDFNEHLLDAGLATPRQELSTEE